MNVGERRPRFLAAGVGGFCFREWTGGMGRGRRFSIKLQGMASHLCSHLSQIFLLVHTLSLTHYRVYLRRLSSMRHSAPHIPHNPLTTKPSRLGFFICQAAGTGRSKNMVFLLSYSRHSVSVCLSVCPSLCGLARTPLFFFFWLCCGSVFFF